MTIEKLNIVPFVSVDNMMKLVLTIGVVTLPIQAFLFWYLAPLRKLLKELISSRLWRQTNNMRRFWVTTWLDRICTSMLLVVIAPVRLSWIRISWCALISLSNNRRRPVLKVQFSSLMPIIRLRNCGKSLLVAFKDTHQNGRLLCSIASVLRSKIFQHFAMSAAN